MYILSLPHNGTVSNCPHNKIFPAETFEVNDQDVAGLPTPGDPSVSHKTFSLLLLSASPPPQPLLHLSLAASVSRIVEDCAYTSPLYQSLHIARGRPNPC